MATETLKKLEVPERVSEHSELGMKYTSPAGEVSYSNRLVIATPYMSYDGGLRVESVQMSSMAIEYLLDQQARSEGKDPREAEHNNDLFGRNVDNIYIWQLTTTGLRVPEGWENGRYQTDNKGNKQYPRIWLEGMEEKGDLIIPEGNGRVIVEWDPITGLPLVTSDSEAYMKHENHDSHWYFDPDRNEVAVRHEGGWDLDESGWCLDVGANDIGRSVSDGGGFRPVQGSLSVSAEKFTPAQASQILLLREYERGREEAIAEIIPDLENLEAEISRIKRKYQK